MTHCSVIRIEGENSEKHQKGGWIAFRRMLSMLLTDGVVGLQQRPDGVIVLTYLVTMSSVARSQRRIN
jgi:hypothetical protein